MIADGVKLGTGFLRPKRTLRALAMVGFVTPSL
jgi:hypothetical protein